MFFHKKNAYLIIGFSPKFQENISSFYFARRFSSIEFINSDESFVLFIWDCYEREKGRERERVVGAHGVLCNENLCKYRSKVLNNEYNLWMDFFVKYFIDDDIPKINDSILFYKCYRNCRCLCNCICV